MSQSADDNSVWAGLEEVSDLLRAGEYADAESRLADLVERTGHEQLNNVLAAVRGGDVDPDRLAAELEQLAEKLASSADNDGGVAQADELGREDSPFEVFEEFSGDDFGFDESFEEGLEDLSEFDGDSDASFEGGEQAPTRVAGSIEDIAGGPGNIVAEDEENQQEQQGGQDTAEAEEPVGGTRMGAPQPRGDDDETDSSGLSDLMEEFGGGESDAEQLSTEQGEQEESGADMGGTGTGTTMGEAAVGDESTGGMAEDESDQFSGPVSGVGGSASTQQGTGFEPGSDDQTTAPRQDAPSDEDLARGEGDGEGQSSTLKGEPGLAADSSSPSSSPAGGATGATRRGAPGLSGDGSEAEGAGSADASEDEDIDIDLGLDNPGSGDSAGVDIDVGTDDSQGPSPSPTEAGHGLGDESSTEGPTSEVDSLDAAGFEQTDASERGEPAQSDQSEAAESGDDEAFDLDIDWGGQEEEKDESAMAESSEDSPNESEGPRYDVESSRADAVAEEEADSDEHSRPTLQNKEQNAVDGNQTERPTAQGSGMSAPEDLGEPESDPVDEDRFMELADSISTAQQEEPDSPEEEDDDPPQSGMTRGGEMSGDATDSNEATQAPFMKDGGGSDLYAQGFREESEPTSSGAQSDAGPIGSSDQSGYGNDSNSGAVRLLNEARRLFEEGHLESAHDLAQSILEQSGGHQGAENLLYEIRQRQRDTSKETAEGSESPTPRSVEAVDPSNPPPEAIPQDDLEPAGEVSTVEGADPTGQVGDDQTGIDDMTDVPIKSVGMDEISQKDLDHRYGFVFSMIDGQMTFEDILDVCSMPREETIEVLEGLKARSLIDVE